MKRISFGRVKEQAKIPYLLELQVNSFENFLQRSVPASKRKNQGLEAVFREIFPIEIPEKGIRLEYVSYSIGIPRYSIEEAKRRGVTYSAPLRVRFRLIVGEEAREQDVYMGEIPLITPNASYVINGDERVIVNQLQRSPGVFFIEEEHPTGKPTYIARIIPHRGAWVDFHFDYADALIVQIDRRRTFNAADILRMFGFSTDEDIRKALGSEELFKAFEPTLKKSHNRDMESALLEFHRKMRPTEPSTLEIAQNLFIRMFYDPRYYDMGDVGAFIIHRKLGIKLSPSKRVLTPDIMLATVKYLLSLQADLGGKPDDIDHLGNRRVKPAGELLQEQVRIALVRMERAIRERISILGEEDLKKLLPQHIINYKFLYNQIHDFFARSPLSQFMDQVNPLAETTHKRRLSALGPGGLSRERAGFEVRDIHPSHYGRICPIETPEGPNIGLINSLACYARVNKLGFLETPYIKVENGRLTGKIEYLTADVEEEKIIANANTPVDEEGRLIGPLVSCRYKGDFPQVPPEKVEYMDVSPKQLVSVAASLIPFLEHDDANRALMGSNMQRQAVPLMKTEAPIVGTGMEAKVARDSGAVVIAREAGEVVYVDASRIVVKGKSGEVEYRLRKFERSNTNTCVNQKPIVKPGQKVKKGEVLADGQATANGELALGKNLLVAFMPWRGYNFEDAIVISENVVREDVYTSIHIDEFEIEARETRLGNEEITRDIPGISEEALKDLDENGIIRIGAEVKPGTILVGKITPQTEKELSPEERLLRAIFGTKAGDVKNTSLVAPPGVEGVVVKVEVFERKDPKKKTKKDRQLENARIKEVEALYQKKLEELEKKKNQTLQELLGVSARKAATLTLEDLADMKIEEDVLEEAREVLINYEEDYRALLTDKQLEINQIKYGDDLKPGVLKKVIVYVATKRKLSVGDKLAGRHGNKGVIATIVPREDMPFLADGTPVDVVLNPLGVPSRMNVGQILETHLGWAGKLLGLHFACPVFDGASEEEIREYMRKAGLPEHGKVTVYDGHTGEPFDQEVTVGYMYIMKLIHMVADKIHARAIGPYSLITQQPLGGKAQFGGQRFGEMEVWALEGYGAAATLHEMLTVKSDDVEGRTRLYESIVKGEPHLEGGTPESFNVLMREIRGLGLDIKAEKERHVI